MFKYLGWILEWSDNDCLVVLRNIRKSRQVWGRLGKLLQREGGRAVSLGKVIPHGSSGGAIVWSVDMGAFGATGAEVRGSVCVFPAVDHKGKG